MVDESPVTSVHAASLPTRILQGAGLALGVTALRLLIGPSELTAFHLAVLTALVGFAGGVGGATYYALDGLRSRGGWRKASANVFSLLAFAAAAVAALLVVGVWLFKN
jgi:hypothetical protein